LIASSCAYSEQVTDCARIEDAAERLACFDRQFPKVEQQVPATEPGSESAPVTAPPAQIESKSIAAPTEVVKEPESIAPAAAVVLVPHDQAGETDKPDTLSKGSLFGGDPKVNFAAAIRAIRRGDKQKMVFMLDNEEIWLQVEPRDLPFREGDTVTIKSGFFGGYFMRNDRGTSTRVSRIK
jgi:hypothetical protein